jgi:hypothetical protein
MKSLYIEYNKSINDDTNGRIEFLEEYYYITFTVIIFMLIYYLNII